mmetsp:Transcript_59731/g.143901  ORF Transcript_59731/g.143901 Transcript_59731/m.143901 type:complete len:371 (+) Transcript_59731:361-1473(+)
MLCLSLSFSSSRSLTLFSASLTLASTSSLSTWSPSPRRRSLSCLLSSSKASMRLRNLSVSFCFLSASASFCLSICSISLRCSLSLLLSRSILASSRFSASHLLTASSLPVSPVPSPRLAAAEGAAPAVRPTSRTFFSSSVMRFWSAFAPSAVSFSEASAAFFSRTAFLRSNPCRLSLSSSPSFSFTSAVLEALSSPSSFLLPASSPCKFLTFASILSTCVLSFTASSLTCASTCPPAGPSRAAMAAACCAACPSAARSISPRRLSIAFFMSLCLRSLSASCRLSLNTRVSSTWEGLRSSALRSSDLREVVSLSLSSTLASRSATFFSSSDTWRLKVCSSPLSACMSESFSANTASASAATVPVRWGVTCC